MSERMQKNSATGAAQAAKEYEARAYAAASATSPLAPATVRRRAPGPQDVQIKVLFTRGAADMSKHLKSFEFILDTVSAPHDVNVYFDLLKRDGTLTVVGAPKTPHPVGAMRLLFGRRRLAGSLIGAFERPRRC